MQYICIYITSASLREIIKHSLFMTLYQINTVHDNVFTALANTVFHISRARVQHLISTETASKQLVRVHSI